MDKVWIITFVDDVTEQAYIREVCNTRTLAMQIAHNWIKEFHDCVIEEESDGALRIYHSDYSHYEIESWNVQTEV